MSMSFIYLIFIRFIGVQAAINITGIRLLPPPQLHPVILGEWGFTTDLTYDDQWHVVIGNKTNYGDPIKEFVEGIGIGSIAWCAGG